MKLFDPGTIGTLSLKNRIVMAPMLALVNDPVGGGRVTDRFLDFYIARAKGGVGMIITSFMNPSENWEPSFGEPILDNSKCIAWLNDLVRAVHDYGTKLCVQLSAGFGRNLIFNPELPHAQPVCASAVPSHSDPKTMCRPLTKEDIKVIIRDYEVSVKILTLAGVDAIEMHAHAGYIMDQFLTPLWNTRTDEYGGSLENRFRFTGELIAAIKRAAGDEFPISYRYALTHFHVKIDWPIADAAEDLAKWLRYIQNNLYENGDEEARILQNKLFEYYGCYHSVGGRRTAGFVASQLLRRLDLISTVFVSSAESRSMIKYSERGVSKFFLIKLTDEEISALAQREAMDSDAFKSAYLYPALDYYVGISEAVYGYTPYSKPPEDGKLRELQSPYNWLKLRDEFLHPKGDSLDLRPINYSWVYTTE